MLVSYICIDCCNHLQGLLEARNLEDYDGARYHTALVSRRGRLHVGPRYKARGINDPYAEPANEIECEQVCGRAAGQHSQLQADMRSHSGERVGAQHVLYLVKGRVGG